ncbi:MAG: OmpA family protein [Chlorobi bacterium]|nr:OmpA family protein [Chlorobiota bacterium]
MSAPRFISFILIISALLMQSCSVGNKYSAGMKAYNIGEYHRAIPLLKKAYSKEKNKYAKGEISYYLGDCYRQTNLPLKAASAYSKSVRYKFEMHDAELYMADSYRKAGKYEKALKAYQSYAENSPRDVRAELGIKSCKMAMNDTTPGRYIITKMKIVNSKFSDFCPVYAGKDYDQLYFTSMRTDKKKRKRNQITGQGGADIYFSRIDAKGNWTKPKALEEPINTQFDEGTGSITADGKEMYITRCRYEKEEATNPEIYVMKREGGRWSEPVPVTFQETDSVMFAHPAISPDGKTLYFVSDMPGGQGGKDIWMSTNTGGEWGKPVNMGRDINTPGDEMFPYVRSDGTLYFSSDTHIGYGGLDIFKAVKKETKNGSVYEVINLGDPINTFADDFGIVFKGEDNEGILSSTRGSSRAIDNLFVFSLPKLEFHLKGNVLNGKTKEPVKGAYMRLIGTDGTNLKMSIQEDGSFSMKLKPNTDYVILVAAKGFFNHKEKFSTAEQTESKDFNFEIDLMPTETAIMLYNIYFDENSPDLPAGALPELQRLLRIMLDNPNMKIEIGAHADDPGDDTENLILSQKRAETVRKYLISKGVPEENITSKGYGRSRPLVVDRNISAEYRFLKKGDKLTPDFIQRLKRNNRATAHKLNRRIEFRIVNR